MHRAWKNRMTREGYVSKSTAETEQKERAAQQGMLAKALGSLAAKLPRI